MPPTNIPEAFAMLNKEIGRARLHGYRLSQKVARMEAVESLRAKGREPRYPIEFVAQFGEDALVWDLLNRQTEGFFIEAGAFDGYHLSVTYALECIGWNGVLVEPLPDKAEACRVKRPNSRVVNAALSRRGSAGTVEMHRTSDSRDGVLSSMVPTNISTPLNVEVTTLNDILCDHSGPIDLVSLDVEGSELDALDGFDLDRFRPKVLLIEDNTFGENPALADYMEQQPYTQVAWHVMNRVYVHDSEERLIREVTAYE